MTASEIAEVVNARPSGRGRWQARCPAHDDRSPSLSITEGVGGRTLVYCFAGCSLGSILRAMGLSANAVFSDAPLTSEARHALRIEDARRAKEKAERAVVERAYADTVRRLGFAVDALGAKLMRRPDLDDLSEAFHAACAWLGIAESAGADALA